VAEFVHLHLHTEYSLLDGATRIAEIADKAIKEGQSAVAITDHGVMYGAVEFYEALKKKGVKPIIGCEVYVAPRSRLLKEGKADASGYHLILLCKNEVGYRNLCYLVSESFIHGFYQRPRIDMDILSTHSDGLVALSGCLGGKIPSMILSGLMDEAEKSALDMKRIFGDDFYLEIQNHHMDDERKVAFAIKTIGEKHGIPLVATNDVHYLEKEDADIQNILMCIQTGNTVSSGNPIGFSTNEYYFRSTEEMKALFMNFSGAIENTVKIAEKCNYDFTFGELHLPSFSLPNGQMHKDKLRKDALDGFEKRVKEGFIYFDTHPRKEYTDRIEYELSVIDNMGFNAYFLMVSDFVGQAKSMHIPVGPGRGSGAGSLVAYCIGITDVDPVAYDLLFERFLNPERVSMPDFDIDFSDTRREEVIDYVKQRYGEDKVAQIVTFGTMAAKASIRDVGRALDMPYAAVDAVAKLVPSGVNVKLSDALEIKEFRELYEHDASVKKLVDVSMKLEGMPRHASTHAAGVVITEKPTATYVPLSYSGTGVVTQFDMTTDAKLGLVKFDFLGIRYLTVIDDAEKMIRKHNATFDITKIPHDDAKTFALLCHGKTDGVFQLESAGMKQVLIKLQPTGIEDITACVALYRPGPMSSIETFIERKHGREPITYALAELKPILDVTYGCIVYQEEVMQIFRTLAGYSYAKADIVRRAMAKKNKEAMAAEEEAFLFGVKEKGLSVEAAKKIFDDMQSFASYAFNKSHATAYAILSYRTAYLKANYPAEFFSALLTSVLSDTSEVRKYSMDAQKCGVQIFRPDINESDALFSVTKDGQIRYGLLAIKGVGKNFADAVVTERKNGKYKSFDNFVRRLASVSDMNKRTLESLIKSGVFDSLGTPRSALLASYEMILSSEQDKKRNNITGQIDLFSLSADTEKQDTVYPYPAVAEYSVKELLLLEKESSGMYFSGHLTEEYEKHIQSLSPDKTSDIFADLKDEMAQTHLYVDKGDVKLAGIVTAIKKKTVKNGDTMAFITLDDRYGEIEVIIFPKTFAKFSSEIFDENAVFLRGTLSVEEGDTVRVVAKDIIPLIPNYEIKDSKEERKSDGKTKNVIYVKVDGLSDKRIAVIDRLSMLHAGSYPVILFDNSTKKYVLKKNCELDPSESVLSSLKRNFGEENVVVRHANA